MGFLGNIGTTEIIIILAIVFLLFGGVIVKGAAKKAGQTAKEIKKAKSEFEKASQDAPPEVKV